MSTPESEDDLKRQMEMLRDQFEIVPLHPKLAPYLVTGSVGPMVHHKLVISVPHSEILNKTVNAQYEHKVKMLAQAEEQGDWFRYVFLHERPYRLDAVMELVQEDVWFNDGEGYWKIIASTWTDCENIHENFDEWLELWSSDKSGREAVMDEDEQAALAAMPDTFTVWRGVSHPDAIDGLSWTLDYNKAVWFARRSLTLGSQPTVVEGTVHKKDVLAYFTGRNENEIVVFSENVFDRKVKVL